MLALALAALLAQAPAPAPAAPPPPPAWAGTVSFGLIWRSGNSETLTASANANLERKSPEWIWSAKAFAAYGDGTPTGSTVSQVTALNAGFLARGDRRFTEQLSLYLLAGIDTDHMKSIEARPFGELGVAMIWADEKEGEKGELQKLLFRTDLGFRYGREYRFQYYPFQVSANQDPALATVDVAAPRVGAFLRYSFNKNVFFTEEASALFNVAGDFRFLFVSTSKLSARLTEKMSLGVGFTFNDDSLPPPTKKNVDTALTVGLEIGI